MKDKIDIFQSVKSNAIKEISPEILETVFDSLTESEVLKDIPIFGVGFKGFSLYQNITEAFFIKKLLKFLFELKDIPQKEREQYISHLERKQQSSKAGEKLLITLARLDEIEKAEIIGRLFKETVLGKIQYDNFTRLTFIVDKAYLGHLKSFTKKFYPNGANEDLNSSLYNLGLLSIKISDIEKQRKFLARVGSNRDAQPQIEYSITQIGRIFMENAFEELS